MKPLLHKHQWQRLSDYGSNEWRCTSASKKKQLEHEPCRDRCELDHEHYFEKGCLGTLIWWPQHKQYSWCSPGHEVTVQPHRPAEMVIDAEYLKRVAVFAESLRRLAA